MSAYVYTPVRMYLSASCVRVSMLAFVCVHARVREGVCVSRSVGRSVRPSVRPSVCLSIWSYMRAFINACVRVFACTRSSGRMFESVCPSFRLSVWLSVRVHVRASKCLFAQACIHQCMFDISYFQLLTTNFQVCTWVSASVLTWVCMSIRTCVYTWVHRVCV